ncbi:Ribose_5-phosphate isomerase [Hexamita inflata]|uniref:Ribose 5-phosphate isomerase n=1 Tax=Hexamita inflata TaxID=28002 RepID=A0AA86V8X4_9EUKA|nr:Ribose 5-phosphate isomerase [Hexamita inflata]CAI9959668.1 Ribose 5-phosphate isomerase [Hexamita inflata]
MKIAVASDHGGYELKQFIIKQIQKDHEIIDCGANDATTSVDYPDFAHIACEKVQKGEATCAIVVCGTGIGISIAANKHQGIRCALCHNEYEAEMTRRHNNANALALGGRVTGDQLALNIVKRFLETEFEGGRHQQRIDKISKLEQ